MWKSWPSGCLVSGSPLALLATHLHRPFRSYAKKFKIPLIMLRSPIESTISHAALLCQLKQVQIASSPTQRLLKMCALNILILSGGKGAEGSIILFDEYIGKGVISTVFLVTNRIYRRSFKVMARRDQPVHVMPSDERKIKNILGCFCFFRR